MKFPRYYQAWRAFRAASTENLELGDWLAFCINRLLQQRGLLDRSWNLLDVGGFDGRQTAEVVPRLAILPKTVTLIDPAPEIEQASRIFSESHISPEVICYRAAFDDQFDVDVSLECQLGMLIHSVYYLPLSSLSRVCLVCDQGALVVLDGFDSLFGHIWREFQPELFSHLADVYCVLRKNGALLGKRTVELDLSNKSSEERELVYSFLLLQDYAGLDLNQKERMTQILSGFEVRPNVFNIELEAWHLYPLNPAVAKD